MMSAAPGGAQIIPLEEGWENQIKKKVRLVFFKYWLVFVDVGLFLFDFLTWLVMEIQDITIF